MVSCMRPHTAGGGYGGKLEDENSKHTEAATLLKYNAYSAFGSSSAVS